MLEMIILVVILVFEYHFKKKAFEMKNSRREEGAVYLEMGICNSKLSKPVNIKTAKKSVIPIPIRYIELNFLSIRIYAKISLVLLVKT